MRFNASAASLLLTVLVVAAPLAQAGFTEADVEGPHAFSAQSLGGDGVGGSTAMGASVSMLGVLTADGLGGVTGTRTLLREQRTLEGAPVLALSQVDQSFEGTYTVAPDGRGVLTIVVTPNPVWHYFPHWNLMAEDTEHWTFVLYDGGRRLDLQASLRHDMTLTVPWRWDLVLTGRAESQEPVPSDVPSARELATVKAQLCEVLRLLTTPEWRRTTDAPEVLDACGRTFASPERGILPQLRP